MLNLQCNLISCLGSMILSLLFSYNICDYLQYFVIICNICDYLQYLCFLLIYKNSFNNVKEYVISENELGYVVSENE